MAMKADIARSFLSTHCEKHLDAVVTTTVAGLMDDRCVLDIGPNAFLAIVFNGLLVSGE